MIVTILELRLARALRDLRALLFKSSVARDWDCRAFTCGLLDYAEKTLLEDVLASMDRPNPPQRVCGWWVAPALQMAHRWPNALDHKVPRLRFPPEADVPRAAIRASRRAYRRANFPAHHRTFLPRQQCFRKNFSLRNASQMRARGSVVTSVDSKRARFSPGSKIAHIVCSSIERHANAMNCWSRCAGVFRRFRSRERRALNARGPDSM
jgi:hypothetical protein